uniref:Chitin-binding type-2 domain-containing protein n=1 Tax=Anopheles dirus TaxID=7168 RepID=A0A182NJ82_9DIPT
MKSPLVLLVVVVLAVIGLSGSARAACGPNARCPADASNYLLPHPNCSQYYLCNHGTACEQNCPPGQHFNSYHRQCEAPETACCDIYIPCNPTA